MELCDNVLLTLTDDGPCVHTPHGLLLAGTMIFCLNKCGDAVELTEFSTTVVATPSLAFALKHHCLIIKAVMDLGVGTHASGREQIDTQLWNSECIAYQTESLPATFILTVPFRSDHNSPPPTLIRGREMRVRAPL